MTPFKMCLIVSTNDYDLVHIELASHLGPLDLRCNCRYLAHQKTTEALVYHFAVNDVKVLQLDKSLTEMRYRNTTWQYDDD